MRTRFGQIKQSRGGPLSPSKTRQPTNSEKSPTFANFRDPNLREVNFLETFRSKKGEKRMVGNLMRFLGEIEDFPGEIFIFCISE